MSHLRTLHLTQWFSTSNPLSPWGICNVWRYFWSHIVRYSAKYPIVHRTSSYSKQLCVCSVTQSCLSLCELMDCSPPASSTYEIFQARILEWVAISIPGDLSDLGIEPTSPVSPALAGGFFTTEPPRKPYRKELPGPKCRSCWGWRLWLSWSQGFSPFLLDVLWLYISHRGVWFIFSSSFHFLHLVLQLIQYSLLKDSTALNCLGVLAKAHLD